MSAPDSSPPDSSPPGSAQAAAPQSPLSEAVEQATDTVKLWYEDLAGLGKRQANRFSSGRYGLRDLVDGQFGLMRIAVKHATAASQTIVSNLALLASTPPDPARVHDPPIRELKVAVNVPSGSTGRYTSSDLVGRRRGFRVRGSSITCVEEAADTSRMPAGTAQASPGHARVLILTINFGGAPNDIYDGVVRSADKAVSAPFMVPLAEFGVAGSKPEVRTF